MSYPPLPSHIQPLTQLDAAWRESCPGQRLESVRAAGRILRDRILESGRVTGVRTFDTSMAPYPTRFGFGGVARSPLPYMIFTNRVNIVQFETDDGLKTLLFNPTDYERSAEAPFYARLRERAGMLGEKLLARLKQPKPHERLAAVGLRPEDVDYIAFDHMHVQDVREMLGTTRPALGQQAPVRALYPRARFLIWRPELEIFRKLHPLQRTWYIEEAVKDIPEDRFLVCDGDVLLGKGCALVRTPGHTIGNWSLVINTDRGVWAVSENGVSCDNYAPNASRIGGLKKHHNITGEEVILNSNTLEGRNDQYTSMVLEKALVDRVPEAPEFFQHFPSSELTPTPFTPGLSPTFSHGGITSGQLRRPTAAQRTQAA